MSRGPKHHSDFNDRLNPDDAELRCLKYANVYEIFVLISWSDFSSLGATAPYHRRDFDLHFPLVYLSSPDSSIFSYPFFLSYFVIWCRYIYHHFYFLVSGWPVHNIY